MSNDKTRISTFVAAVEADVLDGLDDFLRPLDRPGDPAFVLDGPFAASGALVDEPFAVVGWRYRGVDDGAGFNGMWPTGKVVTVCGLTIIDTSSDDWTFHRHVDWNGVDSQLGGSRGRTSSPVLVKKPDEARYLAALCHGMAMR